MHSILKTNTNFCHKFSLLCGKRFYTSSYRKPILDPNNLLKSLADRNLLFQHTASIAQIFEKNEEKCGVYAGFDPTSNGLHLGNLVILHTLKLFQQIGYPVVGLIGGATGLIGDPSGKTQERPLLQQEMVEKNAAAIRKELQIHLGDAKIVNNVEWLGNIKVLDFMREVGKHFHINNMIKLETVKTRLENADSTNAGMTFTEFSYPLFQSFDFYHLFKEYNVRVQIGGSDQWGNITSGIDYVKRRTNKNELIGGITIPLLTTSDGKKFGKSEGNAIFLNAEKTSCYDFYQYFMRIPDSDITKLFKMLTFYSLEEIKEIENEHFKNPESHFGQKELAKAITLEIHGKEGLEKAQKSSEILFGNSEITGLSSDEISILFRDAPCAEMQEKDLINQPICLVAKNSNMFPSSNQAKKLIKSGGFYINNRKAVDENYRIQPTDLIDDSIIVLRSGKKNYHIIKKI